MTHWHESTQIKTWFREMLSPLHLLMVIILVITTVSEWQMDWCEHLVGAYLASSNDKRPETGTVWETGDRTATAQSYLKTITDSRKEATRYAREASSFIQLASGILPGQWTHISKTHFKQLYLALPEPTAAELIPPLELVWLFNGTDMDKIFCEGKSHGLDIYFLTPGNRVIRQVSLSRTTVADLDQDNSIFKGTLEDIDDFAGTIYPADHFFKTTLKLPAGTLSELIIRPERLLPDRGKISRVGIWPGQTSGYVQMGFEVQGPRGNMVIFTKGRNWAVQQLIQRLTEKVQ
jgi:hypothetical protein